MKNRIFKNLLLKIISVVFAVVAWLIIVNVDNPTTTKTIYNVPVTLKNTATLTDAGSAYEIVSGETIAVQVKGPRNIVDSLKTTDFIVIADVDTREIKDTIPIEVACTKTGVTCVKVTPSVVKLTLEDIEERSFDVQVKINGTPADNYAIGSTSSSRTKVRITGPVSQLNLISQVVAEVDVSDAAKDLYESVVLKLYDGNGDIIDPEASKLSMNVTDVNVAVSVLRTKTINVSLTVSGEAETDYRYTGMYYTPKSIVIAGYDEDLTQISTLIIPSDVLSITGLTETTNKQISISSYLPQGITLVSEESTIDVTLYIEPVIAQEVTINKENITINGQTDGLEYSFSDTNPLAVNVKGIQDELDTITDDSIKASISVSGLVAGTHSVKVTLETEGTYKIVDEYYVAIVITEKPVEEESSTEETTTVQSGTN